jgi:polysaccharide biosynthesis protein PslG
MSNAQMTAHFQAEKAAGAGVTRLTVDVLYDTQFGNQFQLAKAAGLKVIAVIAGQTSTGAGAYAQKAQWAAQAYGSQGLYKIELGNEWNLHGFTPALAASYQKAAYTAIKSVCSSCIVISNGLAEWGRYVDGTMNPVRFLELEYAAGLKGSFDELGWHPYLYNDNWTAAQMLSLTNPWSGMAQLGALAPSARSLMSANGDGAKKITATEWGAPTDDAADGFTGGVTPAEQANLMTQGIAWWKQQSWAGDLVAYEYQDIANSPTDRECHFGLVDYNGTAKPALAAYKNAVP